MHNNIYEKQTDITMTDEYKRYRKVTFSMPPDKVGFNVMEPKKVYGMNMDFGVFDPNLKTKFVFTTTVFINGEAAFMPSPGGGTMGLGRFPAVAEIAKSIVALGQSLVSAVRSTDDNRLPDQGDVIFYFFTTTGLYGIRDTAENFKKGPYAQLLMKFAQIRTVGEKMLDERKK